MEMDTIKVESVILCTKERRGEGTQCSPTRIITEVFTLDGKLIAEHDSKGGYTMEQMFDFLSWCAIKIQTSDNTFEIYTQWLKKQK